MSIENVREILADPIIEQECADEKHFLDNVLRWSLRLAQAAIDVRPECDSERGWDASSAGESSS